MYSKIVLILSIVSIASCVSVNKDFAGRSSAEINSIVVLVDDTEHRSFGAVQGGLFEQGFSVVGGWLTKPIADASLTEKARAFENKVSSLVDEDTSYREKFVSGLSSSLQRSGYEIAIKPAGTKENIVGWEPESSGLGVDAILEFEFKSGYLYLRSDIRPQTELFAKLISTRSGEILYQAKFYCCAAKETSGPAGTSLAGNIYRFETVDDFVQDKEQAKKALKDFTSIVAERVASDLSAQ